MSVPTQVESVLADLPWSARRRLEYIEFHLGWYGQLVRNDLRRQFGISAPQATTDIERYSSLVPENLAYDATRKCFVRAERFHRVLTRGQSDRRLLQMRALSMGWLERSQSWFDDLPPVEVLHLRRREVADELLTLVLDAVREKRYLQVRYWTMSGKPATERLIAPHAFAFGSDRWHVRAFDKGNDDFRDFNLIRMDSALLAESAEVEPELDFEWTTFATMRLVANPELSEAKCRAIRHEFAFESEVLEVPCRLALLFYMRSEFGLDDDELPADRRPLLLENGQDLEAMRMGARQLSANAISGRRNAGR